MTQIILITLALVPILLFVVIVILMDAFSLTERNRMAFSLISGGICFLLTLALGELMIESAAMPYITAIVAEFLKGLPLLYLVQKRKIVMLGDATIYGSAVGAGYALVENIHLVLGNYFSHSMAVMLGFEAAVMHIGCTSLLALGLIIAKQETSHRSFAVRNLGVLSAFAAAMIVHIIHNVVPINPIILTSILVVYFLVSKHRIFKKNEKAIHSWIDQCLNNDVALLGSIRKGELAETNAGKYLLSIKDAFEPETFFDICCYISEYLELSITAKSNLLLKESGFPVIHSEETKARIKELTALKQRIGKTGVNAVQPIVNINDVDQWVMNALL